MKLIFNPCGEFRWSPEGPVSQIPSPHLQVGASRIFSDLIRSVQMLNREWGAQSNGKLPYLFIPRKTWFLSLQPWFLYLKWKICPWAEHSDDDEYYNKYLILNINSLSELNWIYERYRWNEPHVLRSIVFTSIWRTNYIKATLWCHALVSRSVHRCTAATSTTPILC